MNPLLIAGSCVMVWLAAAAAPVAAFQAPVPAAPVAAFQGPAPSAPTPLLVVAGGSTVVQTGFPITRIAVTNPAVADATLINPKQLLVDGKVTGTVSLIVWGGDANISNYEVVVYAPTPALQRQFKTLFPNEDITVSVADEAIVLSGRVSSNVVAQRAAEIAEKSSAKAKVINMLQLPGGNENQQVMLQVRVAEVSQRALLELGSTLFTGPAGIKNFVGLSSTQQFNTTTFEGKQVGVGDEATFDAKFSFSDLLNLFVLNTKYDVGVLIKALMSRGFFQSLAEPTLIAYNGQEASFLAGGEIPVPIAQGLTGAVTVTYKEFGVRLSFRPNVAGDIIRLKVKPEVSSIDFASGVTLEGFRIPGLTTRRFETEVELRDGQSFAIGGLLNNLTQTDRAAVPLLSSIPIIGNLFKSKAERKERTELVVLITPRLVRPLNASEVPPMPTRPEHFLPPASTIKKPGGGSEAPQAPGSR
jgi:pilus assembly protein CpaC